MRNTTHDETTPAYSRNTKKTTSAGDGNQGVSVRDGGNEATPAVGTPAINTKKRRSGKAKAAAKPAPPPVESGNNSEALVASTNATIDNVVESGVPIDPRLKENVATPPVPTSVAETSSSTGLQESVATIPSNCMYQKKLQVSSSLLNFQ